MLYFFLSGFSLKSHVTDLSSLFDTFHIKGINENNCEDIRRHLVIAMAGKHAPKKLHLEFLDQLTPVKRQMLLDYMEVISFLEIGVYDEDKEFLLQQSTLFESLESLKLNCHSSKGENDGVICEALLVKHAHNLKNLEIYFLKEKLSVPVLPVIDSLVLNGVGKEAAQSLYEQSRNTITSFTNLGVNIQLSNSAAYKGECLFPFLKIIAKCIFN